MASFTPDPLPTRRHTFAEGALPQRSSRSWTSNGVNYYVESTSYTSPGFGYGMMGSTSPSGTAENPPRRRGTGLLGTAINLLASGLAQRAEQNARRQPRRSSVDGLAYGDDHDNGQRSTLFSNFTQRESTSNSGERRSSTRGQSPRRRRHQGGETRRTRSYRSEDHQPSRSEKRSAYVEDLTDSESDDSSMDEESLAEALENDAKYHYREAIKCKERAQRLLQRPTTDPERLQRLVDDIKKHESAYETARENLKALQDNRNRKPHQQTSNRPRATFTSGTSQSRRSPADEFDFFFQTQGLHRSPFSEHFAFSDGNTLGGMPFADFSYFFNDFGRGSPLGSGFPNFFAMHGTSSHGRAPPNARSMPHGNTYSSQTAPSFSTPRPPPSPPANLLKPDEAKQLFKIYNERWNSLGPTDPNIPYPARKLHPSGLCSRDSIWAPMVTSSISEWSQEVIMQANAQAFYLGVVGLSPQYTESSGSGKIVMGYAKSKASAAQVKELVDILKKEKARWHSDRLGRRNGGGEGANEALQRDEKARAVFHAVCELMEAAQGS